MIPKKIHYVWLSDKIPDKIPDKIQQYIDTWKKVMPDYEIIRWDSNSFDVEKSIWVKQAVQSKKWAFAADYIRLYALYNEGGVYLDSDVIVKKKFDDFLNYDFFSSYDIQTQISSRIGIQCAIMGAKAKHPFLKYCLDYYADRKFILPNGKCDMTVISYITASIAEKYGFIYENKRQSLQEGLEFFPTSVFAARPAENSKNVYAVHCCLNSWTDIPFYKRVYLNITKNNFIRKIFGKRALDF